MVDNISLTKGKERIYAYLDECGGYGFDFTKKQNSPLFIIAAILIKGSDVKTIEERIDKIRKEDFRGTEIKSKNIKGNCERREKIIKKTLDLPYSIFALVVDKRTVFSDHGITKNKKYFYEFLNDLVYKELRSAYPYLSIVTDQVGENEYVQEFVLEYLLFRFKYNSFRRYISTKEIMGALIKSNFSNVTEQAFRNKVIGKLRDNGVIISSSSKGYKLPSSEKEIFDYYQHVNSVVLPMVHRLNLCNNLLKMAGNNNVDYLEKGEFGLLQQINSAYQEILHNLK